MQLLTFNIYILNVYAEFLAQLVECRIKLSSKPIGLAVCVTTKADTVYLVYFSVTAPARQWAIQVLSEISPY